jgi:hypothetical protein
MDDVFVQSKVLGLLLLWLRFLLMYRRLESDHDAEEVAGVLEEEENGGWARKARTG